MTNVPFLSSVRVHPSLAEALTFQSRKHPLFAEPPNLLNVIPLAGSTFPCLSARTMLTLACPPITRTYLRALFIFRYQYTPSLLMLVS